MSFTGPCNAGACVVITANSVVYLQDFDNSNSMSRLNVRYNQPYNWYCTSNLDHQWQALHKASLET